MIKKYKSLNAEEQEKVFTHLYICGWKNEKNAQKKVIDLCESMS